MNRHDGSSSIPGWLQSMSDSDSQREHRIDCGGWSNLFTKLLVVPVLVLLVVMPVVLDGRGFFLALFFLPVGVLPVWLRHLQHEFGSASKEIPTQNQLVRQFFKGFYVGSMFVVGASYLIVLVCMPLLNGDHISTWSWSIFIPNAIFSSVILSAIAEESTKYVFTRHYKSHFHPSLDGILIYAVSVALGLSICENILHMYVPSVVLDDNANVVAAFYEPWRIFPWEPTWPFVRDVISRTVLCTGTQCVTGILVGLGIARRDILGESEYHVVKSLGRPIIYHACYNFLEFTTVFALHRWDVMSSWAYYGARFAVFVLVTGYALGYAKREHARMRVLSGRLAPPDYDVEDSLLP